MPSLSSNDDELLLVLVLVLWLLPLLPRRRKRVVMGACSGHWSDSRMHLGALIGRVDPEDPLAWFGCFWLGRSLRPSAAPAYVGEVDVFL